MATSFFEGFLVVVGVIILFIFFIYSSSVSSTDSGNNYSGDNYYIGSYIDEFSGASGS